MQTVSFLTRHARTSHSIEWSLTCRETGEQFIVFQTPAGFVIELAGDVIAVEPSRERAMSHVEAVARLNFLVAQSECGHYALD